MTDRKVTVNETETYEVLLAHARTLRDHTPLWQETLDVYRCKKCRQGWPCELWTQASEALDV